MKNIFLKKYITAGLIAIALIPMGSCKKNFLDTVPDNITTLEKVFSNRVMSEQWLARVYSAVPDMWDQPYNFFWTGVTDEAEFSWPEAGWTYNIINNNSLTSSNTSGFWQTYYQGIRNAGIFIQNIDNNQEIKDLANGPQLIQQYKGEARFLRAYYYFQLMKIYGPVVLMGEVPGGVDDNYQMPRNTWEECVAYVINEMDKAKLDVPDAHTTPAGTPDLVQTGRITKGIIMAVQSQVLLYDASPLYNGNPELANFKNLDGKQWFSTTADNNKWKKAADAAKAVIDLNKWQLYKETNADPFLAAFNSCKNLYWNGWQTEGIWLRTSSANNGSWERHCSPRAANGSAWNGIATPQEFVNGFRMANGMAITDPGSGYTETGFTATAKTGFYVANTSNMYMNREPRFYVDISFTGSMIPVVPLSGQTFVQYYNTGNSGRGGLNGTTITPRDYPKTGYAARKNIHPNNNWGTGVSVSRPAMLIRLAEIYLNYAEALNEYSPGNADILTYLNYVRTRGGLAALASGLSQDDMRKQIRLERQIELCFEGHRYFDVRRWKVAGTPEYRQSGDFYGMDMTKGTSLTDVTFYQKVIAFRRPVWQTKRYFWPLPQSEMDRNKLLAQPPGY